MPGAARQDLAWDVRIVLSVPGIHCAGCIARIEGAFVDLPGIRSARVNVSRKTVHLRTDPSRAGTEAKAIACLARLGFAAHARQEATVDKHGALLVRCLAVAAFAAMNVMLMSVSVWSGADGTTRDLMHWFSALIAVPAAIYAGRPFYLSAWLSVRSGSLNMDVPITLAVVLACGLSLYETVQGGEQAYFDAAVTLLFFLLIGRTLDHYTRNRMRESLADIADLLPSTVRVSQGDGWRDAACDTVNPGATIMVAAGGRLPLDCRTTQECRFDLSHVTGESEPAPLRAGEDVPAGALALDGPLILTVLRDGDNSFVAELKALIERAELSRPSYIRLADRAARFYTPLVHLIALLTAIGWLVAGASLYQALTIAVAVLIITCPCALGLAVPAVHSVALDMLARAGIVVRDGAALERLQGIDAAVLDKTGTITEPVVGRNLDDDALAVAAGLAAGSTHPLSRGLVEEARRRGIAHAILTELHEASGAGMRAMIDGSPVSLGSAPFVEVERKGSLFLKTADGIVDVEISETLRPDAQGLIADFLSLGINAEILTGDTRVKADKVVALLEIPALASARPEDKVRRIQQLHRQGRAVMMVGDGLNDTAALSAADVSMAPGNASDLARNAADFVLLNGLTGVGRAIAVSRGARRHALQNFAIAAGYNVIAVPLAIAGVATPLHAAIAMSTSSILVTLNALRLRHTAAVPRPPTTLGPPLAATLGRNKAALQS